MDKNHSVFTFIIHLWLIKLKQVRFPLSVCFIHPLPPAGYSRLSQGESWLQPWTGTHHTDCPPETGGTRSEATEGVDSFPFSPFTSHLSLRKVGWWGLQITITGHSLWGAGGVVQWQSSRVGLKSCILVVWLMSWEYNILIII